MKLDVKVKEVIYKQGAQLLRRVGASSLLAHYSLQRGSYLTDQGWFRSISTGRPEDASGAPLPWLVYPMIDLLSERVQRSHRVFEYGSGASSLWWASRVDSVVSVEHEQRWFQLLISQAPSNLKVRYCALDAGYEDTILDEEGHFDIVIIDGRHRVACARSALERLSSQGVIIWDNSERERYQEGLEFLCLNGFKLLRLNGFSPSSATSQQTTLCYRESNCLGV